MADRQIAAKTNNHEPPQAAGKDSRGVYYNTIIGENSASKGGVVNDKVKAESPNGSHEGGAAVADIENHVIEGGPTKDNGEEEGDMEHPPPPPPPPPIIEEITTSGIKYMEDYLKYRLKSMEFIVSPDVSSSCKEALLSNMAEEERALSDMAEGYRIFSEELTRIVSEPL